MNQFEFWKFIEDVVVSYCNKEKITKNNVQVKTYFYDNDVLEWVEGFENNSTTKIKIEKNGRTIIEMTVRKYS